MNGKKDNSNCWIGKKQKNLWGCNTFAARYKGATFIYNIL
jgi:hypothetical protein